MRESQSEGSAKTYKVVRQGLRVSERDLLREEIHLLIRNALHLPDGRRLSRALERLRQLLHRDCGTLRTQTTVREFLLNLEFYRSYLQNPNLCLPPPTRSERSF